MTIEHAGPLAAIVVVEGAYDLAAVGNGGLGSLRRYVFAAGSPTVLVRQAVSWEGDLCGGDGWDLTCDSDGNGTQEVNGLLVERLRDALSLDLSFPRSIIALGGFDAAPVLGMASAGQEARVRQGLRASRTAPLSFELSVPGTAGASGQKADGGLLAVGGAEGAVAVALNHMHRYEPQALRLLANGQLAIDIADDRVWLGQRQGLFATLAVSSLPGNPSRTTLDERVWAPLNSPLRAWPDPAWLASSEAVDEFPVGSLPPNLANYDTLVSSVLETTLQQVDQKGLAGLMTFGLYPRFWGSVLYGDELDCGTEDEPTPAESWDNTYWCASWTDYHNTVATAPIWAMRTGEVDWLDEIGFPGALRTRCRAHCLGFPSSTP